MQDDTTTTKDEQPKPLERQTRSKAPALRFLLVVLALLALALLTGCSNVQQRLENEVDDLSRATLLECDPANVAPLPKGTTLSCRSTSQRRADAASILSHRSSR